MRLRLRRGSLRFAAPVTHVYNPLEYAWGAYRRYLERFPDLDPAAIRVITNGFDEADFGLGMTALSGGQKKMVGLARLLAIRFNWSLPKFRFKS